MVRKTYKQSIRHKLSSDVFFILFGWIHIESIIAHLKIEGFKRIPNKKRLERMIKKITDKKL